MVFGEIIEPSTRALIDDELEEYPDYEKAEIEWEGDSTIPLDLETLVFVEGAKITTLFNAFVLNSQQLYCKIQSGDIQIYKITENLFVVLYTKKTLTTGEIIEELSQWILKAKHVYTVTSEPLARYQTLDMSVKPETLIRQLSTLNSAFKYKKLESPNLVSGLGADVLSYTIHTGLNSTLFVIYMNNSPLDSIIVSPIIELMQLLKLPVSANVSKLNPPNTNNLYL